MDGGLLGLLTQHGVVSAGDKVEYTRRRMGEVLLVTAADGEAPRVAIAFLPKFQASKDAPCGSFLQFALRCAEIMRGAAKFSLDAAAKEEGPKVLANLSIKGRPLKELEAELPEGALDALLDRESLVRLLGEARGRAEAAEAAQATLKRHLVSAEEKMEQLELERDSLAEACEKAGTHVEEWRTRASSLADDLKRREDRMEAMYTVDELKDVATKMKERVKVLTAELDETREALDNCYTDEDYAQWEASKDEEVKELKHEARVFIKGLQAELAEARERTVLLEQERDRALAQADAAAQVEKEPVHAAPSPADAAAAPPPATTSTEPSSVEDDIFGPPAPVAAKAVVPVKAAAAQPAPTAPPVVQSTNPFGEEEEEEGEDTKKDRPAHAVPASPVWMKDSEASNCLACNTAFTWIKRRHHCRFCKRLVCGDCSGHQVAQAVRCPGGIRKRIVKFRVCDSCHAACTPCVPDLQAAAAEPEAAEPEAAEPEVAEPEATKPEATKPEAAEPEPAVVEASDAPVSTNPFD